MQSSPLLHVLGGGDWQLPTVRKAKAMGLRVLVTDMFEQRPAYALADQHEQIDITDRRATLAASRRHQIDGVICDTTDIGVPTAAFVAEHLGLPGIGLQVAQRFTDKSLMRMAMAQAGIASPASSVAQQPAQAQAAAAELGLPLVMKPVDNQSGRGVSIVRAEADLAQAWALARSHSRSGKVILESLAAGDEYIVDGFAGQDGVQILGIAAKTPYDDNPTISSRILYLSGNSFHSAHAKLAPVTRRVIAAMGLRSGIFHAEFKVDGAAVVPIDLAARGGGVHIYPLVLPHVSGIDAIAAMISACLGQPAPVAPKQPSLGACIEFFRLPQGRLLAIEGVQQATQLAGVAAVQILADSGQQVGALLKKDDRPGYIVALAETHQEAQHIAARAKACLQVRMAESSLTHCVI